MLNENGADFCGIEEVFGPCFMMSNIVSFQLHF